VLVLCGGSHTLKRKARLDYKRPRFKVTITFFNNNQSDVFDKTQKYVNTFGLGKNLETTKEIQKLGKRRNLHPFEVASLANLNPTEVEEAKTLIPSLKRFMDDEVQKMLNDLENLNEL
jgi:DNA-directed RNA polymerase II subunit RPB4